MAVSDLTNTTWVFKQGEFTDEISITDATYNINFISNSVNYSQIILADTYDYGTISYNTTEVYMYHYEDSSQTGWYYQYYRTIEITGGTDVTNANLIAWLEANATQQGGGTTGKTQIGTRAITKKMFGTREITKEVVNGVVVYEKQAPSGFSVSGTNDVDVYGDSITKYSTDNGVTWLDIPTGNFTLPAMTTFKLKLLEKADYFAGATSTQLGLNLPLTEGTTQTSSNYTLTQNITDLTITGHWD